MANIGSVVAAASPVNASTDCSGGVLTAVSICLFLIVGFNLISAEKSDVAELRPRQLSDISRYLKSAYRNGDGSGALVIGQVDEEWQGLSQELRVEAAQEMRRALEVEQVMNAMIYDGDHRLQIHLASGQIRRPLPVGADGR